MSFATSKFANRVTSKFYNSRQYNSTTTNDWILKEVNFGMSNTQVLLLVTKEQWLKKSFAFRNQISLQPAILLKLTLLHGCFSRFLNCTNGTKLRNTPHMIKLIHCWYFYIFSSSKFWFNNSKSQVVHMFSIHIYFEQFQFGISQTKNLT